MGSLPTLQLVECAATDFTSLDRCLAVGGQILAGTDVVVDTKAHFSATVAHETEGPNPVGDQEARGMVGGCLAVGGTEADGGENGTEGWSASFIYLMESRLTTLLIILFVWFKLRLGVCSYNCTWKSESERPRDEIMSADRIHFQQPGCEHEITFRFGRTKLNFALENG